MPVTDGLMFARFVSAFLASFSYPLEMDGGGVHDIDPDGQSMNSEGVNANTGGTAHETDWGGFAGLTVLAGRFLLIAWAFFSFGVLATVFGVLAVFVAANMLPETVSRAIEKLMSTAFATCGRAFPPIAAITSLLLWILYTPRLVPRILP